MVYNNSTEFLNGSPSFLTANREKTIQASTVKNNIQDWTKLVENQRRTYAMGPGAFEQLQTHPEWIKLTIKFIKMQAQAEERQKKERLRNQPSRNDSRLAPAVSIPAAADSPNAIRVSAEVAANVAVAARGSLSAHPASVQPNNIQVFSGSQGSSNTKKRLLAFAAGTPIPTAERRQMDSHLGSAFLESVESHRSSQELQGQAALLIATQSLVTLASNLDDTNPIKKNMLDMGMSKLHVILTPDVPLPLPESAPVIQEPTPTCAICLADLLFNPIRQSWQDVEWTNCEHAFHTGCLATHRSTSLERRSWAPVKCPLCNAELP